MKKTITFELKEPGEKVVEIPLANIGDEVELYGLVEATKPGDYVVKTLTDHKAPRTYGRVVVKGIAAHGARVSVDGMVKVEAGAEGTDSFLEMRVLLLDKISSARAEPKLEIENNNVKASHAATVGKIDEEQLMYLQSRGVEIQEAKKVIIDGFLGEIRDKMVRKIS